MKRVLRDHCHDRPLVLKDQILLAGPTFQCIGTCHQRPPALRDYICMANWGGLSRQVLLYKNYVVITLLYVTPISRHMTLGKVDQFGQFVSEFDPEPDKDKKKGGTVDRLLKDILCLERRATC